MQPKYVFLILLWFSGAILAFGSNNQRWAGEQVFGVDPVPTIHLRRGGQVGAISGDIERDYEDQGYPWRHHVDFDELHPGEDLIAEETSFVHPPPSYPQQPNPVQEIQDSDENDEDRMTSMMDFLSSLAGPRGGGEPWWKGANVCVKREEEDRSQGRMGQSEEDSSEDDDETIVQGHPGFHMKFASCVEQDLKYVCETHLIGPNINKTVRTERECCPGYLLSSGTKLCQRGELKSISNTMEDVGGREFTRLIQTAGLSVRLESAQNLTVFVPSDEGVKEYLGLVSVDTNTIPNALSRESERRRRNVFTVRNLENPRSPPVDENSIGEYDWRRNALEEQEAYTRGRGRQTVATSVSNSLELQQSLLTHMSKGKLSTDDFVDEKVIYGEDGGKGTLRLNNWNVGSKKIRTVNCARLVSTNHQCSNGIVHVVDRMFKPVTQTISDVIASNTELSTLSSLLRISGHSRAFQDTKEHLTLFAPTNAAFQKLGTAMMHKLRNGDPCLKRILAHHILPFTLCSTIIFDKGQIRNSVHEVLDIERRPDDKLFVNGTQIIVKDIVTTNGVVHIIDAVLLSSNDKPISSALARAGLSSFLELVTEVGLRNYLEEISNVTIFAPTNEAVAQLPREVRTNSTRLRDVVLYHIGALEKRACHFENEYKMPTKLNNLSIRIDLYSMFPFLASSEITAQCGRLTKVNTPACNGIIHTVDRVLIPPLTDILQTLKTQADFSILTRLIKETNLTEVLKGPGPFSIFAPTDSVFYALPRETLENILRDKGESLQILRNHIVQESICCSGVPPSNWFMTKRVQTLSGTIVPLQRNSQGQVMYGQSKVVVCDLTASNGVIHTVDKLISSRLEEQSTTEFMSSCLPKVTDIHDTMFFGF